MRITNHIIWSDTSAVYPLYVENEYTSWLVVQGSATGEVSHPKVLPEAVCADIRTLFATQFKTLKFVPEVLSGGGT